MRLAIIWVNTCTENFLTHTMRRPALTAAASVTRTNSNVKTRSIATPPDSISDRYFLSPAAGSKPTVKKRQDLCLLSCQHISTESSKNPAVYTIYM